MMQDVASDNGMGPVSGGRADYAGDVGGLVAAVESKMAELMAWHAQQVKQLETDKTVLRAQADEQKQSLQTERDEVNWLRGELDADRQRLAQEREALHHWRQELEAGQAALNHERDAFETQRRALSELAEKLRAEQSAVQREWEEIARQRDRITERAQAWLDSSSELLRTGLKLTGKGSEAATDAGESQDREAVENNEDQLAA